MKKKLSLLLALLMCAALLASCGEKSANPSEPPASAAPPAVSAEPVPAETPEPAAVSFTDSAGRTVEVPYNLTKISPSGQLSQMFLMAIAPDLLVSIASEYTEDVQKFVPANMLSLPYVGQFYGSADLNLESIAAIGPELVIDIGEPKKTIVEDMDSITEALAIPAVHITAALDSSPEAFRALGRLLHREERGEELALYCEKILARTADILALVGDDKVSVLYLLGDAGTNVLAKDSFHSEVLDYVAENLAVVEEPSSKGSGNETSLEQIAVWNPEVILFAPNSVYGTAGEDPVWSQLDAIKNNRYYEVPFGPYNWMGTPPSINRYLGMVWLTGILYPEYTSLNPAPAPATAYDLYEEVAEYYGLFYGYDLDLTDYHEILKTVGD